MKTLKRISRRREVAIIYRRGSAGTEFIPSHLRPNAVDLPLDPSHAVGSVVSVGSVPAHAVGSVGSVPAPDVGSAICF